MGKMATQEITPADLEAQNRNDMVLDNETAFHRLRSASVVTISPELFEKVISLEEPWLMTVVSPTQNPCRRRLSPALC